MEMRILKTKEALEIYNKCDEAKNLVKSELKEYIANHEHFEDIGSRMIDVWNEIGEKNEI